MRPDTPSTSLQVHLPNGATIQSSHSGQIDLPDLPPAAKESHIFPDLSAASLLSVGQLCNSGCKVTFTNKEVNVMLHDKNILSGVRTPHNGLWSIDLPAAQVASTVPTSAPSIPPTHTPSSPSQELNLLTTPQLVCQLVTTSVTQTIADRVAFYHASLFSPTISTWCRAIDAGHLTTWPELTAKQVRAHLPKSIAMLKGHLDQTRANAQSTRPAIHVPRSLMPAAAAACITAKDLAEEFDSHPPSIEGPADVPGQRTHYMYAAIHDAKGQIFTDQPGRFLVASSAGNSYMLVLYDYDSNHIHAEPMPSRTAKSIVDAYTRAHTVLVKAGLRPRLQRLDNEASAMLKQFMADQDIDFQLAPPHLHRRNAAERAIRTFKNHFIAGLCSTDPAMPLHLWCRLVRQACITLNLLRGSRINPKLSAYAQVYGAFDFNRTPLAPPGTKVLVHEKPTVRGTWAPHAVDGWYLGPAENHYRCYRVWIHETTSERIVDTLSWLPSYFTMPSASPAAAPTAAAQDLIKALAQYPSNSPLAPLTDSHRQALHKLAEMFDSISNPHTMSAPTEPIATRLAPPVVVKQVSWNLPSKDPSVNPAKPHMPAPSRVALRRVVLPRVVTSSSVPSPDPTALPTTTYAAKTGNLGKQRRARKKCAQAVNTSARPPKPKKQRGLPRSPAPSSTRTISPTPAVPPVRRHPYYTRSHRNTPTPPVRHANLARQVTPTYASPHFIANAVYDRVTGAAVPPVPHTLPHKPHFSAPRQQWRKKRRNRKTSRQPGLHYPTINIVVDPITGATMSYKKLSVGPDGSHWERSMANEFGRLAQGNGPSMPTGTNTIFFISHRDVPANKTPTYAKIVCEEKPLKAETKRVRMTVGGNKIDYAGDVATPTAELITVKCLLNSVVSTQDAKFLAADAANFYLGTPLPDYEYMRIPVNIIPECIMLQYNLAPLVHNGFVVVEIRKGMYGLPQAGILANKRLKKHLAKAGYHEAPRTPGLFRHETRPVTFCLVVDDFGIKYVGKEHADHLLATLRTQYTMTTDWAGTNYCGLTIDWDYRARTCDISLPGYVERALHRFQHRPSKKPQYSPHAHQKPNYGSAQQLTLPEDTSAPLDSDSILRLQEIVGTFLYYARAVDSTMLVALGSIASANKSEDTARAITHLLNYAATNPDATVRYIASDMCLKIHSDASYLSEPKARSRAGGHFFLSSNQLTPPSATSIPPPRNGAIHTLCQIMKVVLASATEAELGAAFFNAKDGVLCRTILEEMGHPQRNGSSSTSNPAPG